MMEKQLADHRPRCLSLQLCVLLALVYALPGGCSRKVDSKMTTEQLITQYESGKDGEELAAREFRLRKATTRADLIRLLDDPNTPESRGASIVQILYVYFPCDESYQAMDRCAARITDPEQQAMFKQLVKSLRSGELKGNQ